MIMHSLSADRNRHFPLFHVAISVPSLKSTYVQCLKIQMMCFEAGDHENPIGVQYAFQSSRKTIVQLNTFKFIRRTADQRA